MSCKEVPPFLHKFTKIMDENSSFLEGILPMKTCLYRGVNLLKSHKQKIIAIALCLGMLFSVSAARVQAFGEGAQGPDVFAVQGMLKSLGYYSGSIDGIYGPVLKQGVKYFQQQYGLSVTGAIDDQTLENILWAYANLKIPKQTEPDPDSDPDKAPEVPGLTEEEQQMVNLINQERLKAGVQPLQVDLELTKVAREKSQDMINKNYFSHESPTYGSPFEMMKQFGISYSTAGENIACNQSVEKAHDALMNSSGHRANILSENYSYVGIGIVDGGVCGKMFTQMFIHP